MNLHIQHIAQGIYHDMAFPSFHQLTSVYPALLAGILGFGALRVNDPVARCGCLGFFFRCNRFKASRAASHTPRLFHLLKWLYTVFQGGKSLGSIRHWIPPLTTYKIASTMCFFSCLQPLPQRSLGLKWWAIRFHSASVKSLGYIIGLQLKCAPQSARRSMVHTSLYIHYIYVIYTLYIHYIYIEAGTPTIGYK